jgi:type IV secretion system protein VirB4
MDAVLTESGSGHFAERFLAERGLHWAANLISTFEQVRKA